MNELMRRSGMDEFLSRGGLAPFLNRRVFVAGTFTESGVGHLPHNRTAKVVDYVAHAAEGGPPVHHEHHTWVQHAKAILDERPRRNDRVRFWATVVSYRRRTTDGSYILAYGLRGPDGVELIRDAANDVPDAFTVAPPVPRVVVAPPPQPRTDVRGMVRAAKGLAAVHGAEGARRLLTEWDQVQAVVAEYGREDLLDLLVVLG